MVAPHLWPRSVKRVVFFLGVMLVVVAYTTLCSGLFALAMLFA